MNRIGKMLKKVLNSGIDIGQKIGPKVGYPSWIFDEKTDIFPKKIFFQI
jgi:hypothetical protein